MDRLKDLAVAQIGRDGLKNCFRVKHAIEFVAVHAPMVLRGYEPRPERRLIFAMTPFDARLLGGAANGLAAINALEALEKTYILPYYENEADFARIDDLDALHPSRWKLQAYNFGGGEYIMN